MNTDQVQRAHYDRIAGEYAVHYGDHWSQRYRRRFFNAPMLDGLELQGRVVLEAMCGAGETTAELVERGAKVIGLDISEVETEAFRTRWPEQDVHCASILETGLASASVDSVVVVGGLHHVHPKVPEAIEEIHRVLRPGGHFCFVEPHAGSFPDLVRRQWYRRDDLFAANEAALDVEDLRQRFADRFEVEVEAFRGNVAYLMVLNSLVLRLPLSLKAMIAPPLLWAEGIIQPLQGRLLSCFCVGRWKKRQAT